MTQQEFEREFDRKIKQLEIAKLIYNPATAVHDQMTQRLFGKGLDGKNLKLGNYSSKPAYYTKKQFKKTGAFVAQGKGGKKGPHKNGKPRTSMFIPTGYRGLKAAQGYESNFVNLTYTADLRQDFASKVVPTKTGAVVKLSRQNNINKTRWLAIKYGVATFQHTEQEKDFFASEVTKKLIQYLSA